MVGRPGTPSSSATYVGSGASLCRVHIYLRGLSANPEPGSPVQLMSSFEYHVLLALSAGALHGYAVKQRVEEESGGSLTPQAGSLYRVIARLMTSGLLIETDP